MNLTLNNLEKIGTENFADVRSCGGHSNDGFSISTYDFASDVIEVKRKEGETVVFVLKYSEIEIPKYWDDAEVVYTTRNMEAKCFAPDTYTYCDTYKTASKKH